MNYELAKQLKEAGFPQKDYIRSVCPHNNTYLYSLMDGHTPLHLCEEKSVYIPTLEELIEACGDNFSGLNHKDTWNPPLDYPEKWRAYGWSNPIQKPPANKGMEFSLSGYGQTPEEAVANLYIELNKKK